MNSGECACDVSEPDGVRVVRGSEHTIEQFSVSIYFRVPDARRDCYACYEYSLAQNSDVIT